MADGYHFEREDEERKWRRENKAGNSKVSPLFVVDP
jgi:hypothetical protein